MPELIIATYLWSALADDPNGNDPIAFNPNVDVLRFDDVAISAPDVEFNSNESLTVLIVGYEGKTVTFQMHPFSLTSTNLTFDNGSMFLLGDNTTGTANDDGPNTLTGGSGDDELTGLGGNDVMNGGAGNDTFDMGVGLGPTWGNDTITGGSGSDRLRFGGDDPFAINVNFNVGYTDANGIQGTITGGDGNPGSTVSTFGVEEVRGTGNADTFTASSLTPVRSLRSDITQVFYAASGNDTINGAIGNGRNTTISFEDALAGATVNLGTGTASGFSTGNDSFNNVDGVRGSQFGDSLTGGSSSLSASGTLSEYFEGMAGNDTINGGNGGDRADYNHSPGAVNVNLALGTAQDGWGGTDTLVSINHVRGSAFNDTLTGGDGDDNFQGLDGNDLIDGGDGFNEIRYQAATAAVSVNLATGVGQARAGDAGVGIDAFNNIQSVRGSDFNDSLVGGSVGEGLDFDSDFDFFEAFEGRAGNDTIDGGITNAGIDLASYLTAPGGAIVNLSSSAIVGNAPVGGGALTQVTVQKDRAYDGFGSVSGGPVGTDKLIRINAVEGSSFADTIAGGNNNEHFVGHQGNDSINGGGGADTVYYEESPAGVTVNLIAGNATDGSGGTDILSSVENVVGSEFADTLIGDANANRLEGAGGNDTINGGGNTDTVSYLDAIFGVTVNLTTGTATGGAGTDSISGVENVEGSKNNDTLTGDGNANVLTGLSGNDVLRQTAGADTLDGGLGTDRIEFTQTGIVYGGATGVNVDLAAHTSNSGGAGIATLISIDTVIGTAGNDVLSGGDLTRSNNGNFLEAFRGNAGNDTIDGMGSGFGGAGFLDRAEFSGAPGAVIVNLGTTPLVVGTDTIIGGTARDGFGTTDTLLNITQVFGGGFDDTLVGGGSSDTFQGDAGDDLIDGGGGLDEVRFASAPTGVIVNLSANAIDVGGVIVQGGTARDGQGDIDTLISIERPRGSEFDDYLRGGDSAGEERFNGVGGNDTIDGGGGAMDFATYLNVALAFGGINASIANGSGVVANDGSGTTDTLTNIEGLEGSNGNDTLSGGGGVQWLIGRGGDDTLNGGSGRDWVSYANDHGAVIVNLTAGRATDGWDGEAGLHDLGGIDQLTLIENVLGSGFADLIRGSSAANVLEGGAGDDTLNGSTGDDSLDGAAGNDSLSGGSGDDVLTGGAGNDTLDGDFSTDHMTGGLGEDIYGVTTTTDEVFENAGEGFDIVRATSSFVLSENVEVLVLLGTGNTSGVGNTGANEIDGNSGNNKLNGNTGDDVLDGGTGADRLLGAGGNDVLIWDAADVDVQGGSGSGDILRLNGAGQALDLTTISNSLIEDVEVIDITGTGNNDLTLALADVLAISSNTDQLRIDGNAGDDVVVTGGGWTQGADREIGANTYERYTQGTAILLVDTDILLTI